MLVPREGVPRALGHAIEAGPWQRWPAEWPRATYSAWRELESGVAAHLVGAGPAIVLGGVVAVLVTIAVGLRWPELVRMPPLAELTEESGTARDSGTARPS